MSPLHIVPPDFSTLSEIEYCPYGWDTGSGRMGSFVYDSDMCSKGMGMWAISPLFGDVEALYAWAKEKGFKYHSLKACCVLRREFE